VQRIRDASAERRPEAALGFTVKSGWACVVLLAGPTSSPSLVHTRRVEISDPAVADSVQPYHAGFGTARSSGATLRRLVASVRQYGRRSVADLIRSYDRDGHRLVGAGIVVGSLIDPAKIANDHIRIHALEGQLFREVVKDAVARRKLPCSVWRERDLRGLGASTLKRSETELRDTLTGLGRSVAGTPRLGWRSEHKAAALAAWMVLAEKRGRA
jgi:hypothetical protein